MDQREFFLLPSLAECFIHATNLETGRESCFFSGSLIARRSQCCMHADTSKFSSGSSTSVRKKCDSSANDNSAKTTLCRDMLYRQKPEFWDRQCHFFSPNVNPFPYHNLTEIPYPNPNPHPNPRTKTVWRVIRIDFHGLFFDDLLGSVTYMYPYPNP